MAYIYRDFNNNINGGDFRGDIHIYLIDNDTLSVLIFGLYDGTCHSNGIYGDCCIGDQIWMSIKYSVESDVVTHTTINQILNAITNCYPEKTKYGYIESIVNKKSFSSSKWDYTKYAGIPTLPFTQETMKYLTVHEQILLIDYPESIIYCEISKEGEFTQEGNFVELSDLLTKRKPSPIFIYTDDQK